MSVADQHSHTLIDQLVAHATAKSEHKALVSDARTMTHGELLRAIRGGAALLRGAGVLHGDRVIIKGRNTIGWAISYFSIHAAGAVAVPIDAEAGTNSLQHIRERTNPRVIITDDRTGTVALEDFEVGTSGDGPIESPSADDVADILFTTGTTSAPKGVVLTHGNIAHAARNTSMFLRQAAEDVEVVPIPLSHSFGLGRLRCAALVGTTLVLEPGLRNPMAFLNAVESHAATGLALVPAAIALLKRITGDRLAHVGRRLRYMEIGSSSIRPDVRDWLIGILPNARLCHHYGLTEASRAAFVELDSDEGRSGAIGRASPNVSITVRDDLGQPADIGVEGELWVEGQMVAREYLGEPELTRATLRGRTVRTGDIGYITADGVIHLKGRHSDTINVGGLKVAPAEVEEVLNRYCGIVESACIAAPDPIVGERVVAFYVSNTTIDSGAIITWLRAAGVEPHKIPSRFERIANLPKTPSGKLLRRLLHSHLEETGNQT
jgi:long-chain acyl-CoA synthetase